MSNNKNQEKIQGFADVRHKQDPATDKPDLGTNENVIPIVPAATTKKKKQLKTVKCLCGCNEDVDEENPWAIYPDGLIKKESCNRKYLNKRNDVLFDTSPDTSLPWTHVTHF